MKTVAERLTLLDCRILETKAKLQNAESHPLWIEELREQIQNLRMSLTVMEEYRELLLMLITRGEP